MPTAEWYEDLARKIKLKTWKESERFTKIDRVDLILTDKLSKIKPLLTQYETDPVKQYSLSAADKKTIATLKKYAPSLFKEAEPYIKPKTAAEVALIKAQNKAVQAELTGITEPGSTLDTLVKYGIVPELRGKTLGGKAWESLKFPLLKLMTTLMTPERTLGAMWAETAKRAGAGEKYLPGYKPELPTEFKFAPPKLRKREDIKAALKVGGKELIRPIVDIPREPGEPEYTGWASAIKELLPETPVTKPFEYAKEWGAEEAPWYKKAVAGLGGSPADIIGFYLDILTPPFLYISGGLGPGAKTGLRLTKDIAAQGGENVLQKGAMLGLTKAGNKAIRKVAINQADDIVKTLSKVTVKEAKLMPGIKKFLPMGGMTEDAARSFFARKIIEDTLEQTVKKLPYDEAAKLIDFGGLKWGGKTIISGYKLEKITKPAIAWAERKPLVSMLEEAFWTGKGIPAELRPIIKGVKAQMRYRGRTGAELLDDIFKGLSKSEIDDIGKYTWMSSDKALYIARGKKIPAKLLSQLDEITSKLNPKQLAAATRYQDDFTKGFLANFEKELLIQYPELARYYPSRYMVEPKGWARYDIGPTMAPFEKEKTRTYLQAQKLIKEGKIKPLDIHKASLKRIYESTIRSGRETLLQEVKQFGKPFKTTGMKNAGRYIKGLKGWYLPEEIIKPLTNLNKTFYGDEAIRYTMNLIDKGVTVWKKAALFTSGFHGRNFWTDLTSGWMEYGPKFYNPRYWTEMSRIKLRKHIPIKSLGGMYGDDAAKMMLKSGEMDVGMYAVESGLGVSGKWGGFMKNIEWRTLRSWKGRTPFQLSRKVGVAREDMCRVVTGLIEREAGGSTLTASEAVAKVFFNYLDLTPFERQFMRRALFPFYTWYRKNLARQTELLFTRTGRYAMIPKVAAFTEGMTKIPEGYQEYKPEYFADLFVTMTPFRTQDGIPLAINPNIAFQDWSRLTIRDFASSLNPLFKIPIELIGKTEIFFNKPIREGEIVKAPRALQWAKKLPKDIYENFGFRISKDNELYMTERAYYIWRQNPMFYNLARLYPTEPSPKTPYDWLSILVGIKFFPYEEDKSKYFYYQKFIDEVDKKIGTERDLGYETPDIDQIKRAYKQIYADYMKEKYPKVAVAERIRGITKYTGSTDKIKLLIKLMEKPYNDEMAKIEGKTLTELATMLSDLGIKPTMEEINTVINQLSAQ